MFARQGYAATSVNDWAGRSDWPREPCTTTSAPRRSCSSRSSHG
ncbi:hypothetical protein ABTZ93_28015 [Streptomyces sp. NPDC097941]